MVLHQVQLLHAHCETLEPLQHECTRVACDRQIETYWYLVCLGVGTCRPRQLRIVASTLHVAMVFFLILFPRPLP